MGEKGDGPLVNRRVIVRAIAGRELRWRELLFWVLLLAAFQSLEAGEVRRQTIGVLEAVAFFVVAIPSAGKLDGLGLEFISWSPIGFRAAAVSLATGLLAGGMVVMVALRSHQSLGAERGWNQVILAIILGPIIEEVVFRGYLLTAALLLERRLSKTWRNWPSVIGVALIFMFAHIARPGSTYSQLCCITGTGAAYGFIRIHQKSTVGAALAHGCYNLALYLSVWIGLSR